MKAIPQFDKYFADELWNIYSMKSWVIKKLKQTLNRWYLYVVLRSNWKSKTVWVHRLVLTTFKKVEWYESLVVNHIDFNKQNNKLSNLEWCTQLENIAHSNKAWRMVAPWHYWKWREWSLHHKSKPILQLDMEWNLIKKWESRSIACRELWFWENNLHLCIHWITKHAYGYKWKFDN